MFFDGILDAANVASITASYDGETLSWGIGAGTIDPLVKYYSSFGT